MSTTPPANTPRRVLVVDDDDENRKLIVEILETESYQVESAASGEEALQKIESFKPELVMLDYNMPGFSGLETIHNLRRQENYVAVIFVSGNVDQDAVIECLAAGADDYIRKPFNFRELVARIKVRFRNKDVHDALFAAKERLRDLAETDDVTGLYNMRFIYDKIDHELRRAKRFERQVVCVMMDLDHFKSVNDGFDHLFGTFVLKEIGRIVQRNMREVDFAARYGGDEFLMVLTESDAKGGAIFAERIRSAIEGFTFSDGKKIAPKRTASLGYAASTPEEDITAKELIRRADHALYAAKEAGRNRAVAYTPDLDEREDGHEKRPTAAAAAAAKRRT